METSTHLPSKTFSRIAIGLFAMALSAIGLQFLLGFLQAALVFNHVAIPNWAIWLMTSLPMYCVGFPIGFWVMKKVPCEVKEKTAIGGKEFFQLLIMCLPIMYAGNIIGTLLSMLLSGGQATNALDIYLFDDSPLKVLVVVIVAPMLEELMFRKQIIDRCSKYGEKTAILFSSTMFALFHMNLFQCFYAFGIGLILGYVYTRTRCLRYSILMHMIINFMGGVIAPLLLSSIDLDQLKGAADEAAIQSNLLGWIVFSAYAIALIVLTVAGVVLLCKRPFTFLSTEEELPKGQRFKNVYCNVGAILYTLFCVVMIVIQLAA
jgi:membrane protease YdiL (CAAX protease family)